MNVRTKIAGVSFLIAALCAAAGYAHARISAGNIDDSYAIERVSVSRDGRVYAWDRKGEAISGWPVVNFLDEGLKARPMTRLVDVNRDAKLEIVLVLASAGGAEQMRVLRGDGTELTTWRFAFPQGVGSIAAMPIISDINGDNRLELVFTTTSGKVFVFRHAAGFTKLDAYDADFNAAPWLAAADLDNDGRSSLYAVDQAGGEIVEWEADGSHHAFASLNAQTFKGGAASIDVNADEKPELVVGTSAPELLAFDRNGDVVARFPLPAVPAARPLIADIDLDMEPEIVVLLADRTVYSVHRDGTSVRRWDWHLPYEAESSLDAGVVAFDLYEGLISSISGWDSSSVYKTSRERFAELTLGENVHVYDRILAEMEMPITQIDEVVAQPKVITPNADGYNDDAMLSYILSTDAVVTVDLLDAAGNELFRVVENAHQSAGANSVRADGVNTHGTVTRNDDEPLAKGLYFLRITAMNDLGLASRATTPLIVFGVRAQIDLPTDPNRDDGAYPVVYGVTGIEGIATDPNIGEGNDNFDFLAYKVYYRPGIWKVDEATALAAGEAGSPWLTVPVPLQHQSPINSANEPADAVYPASNVSVRPVQHGLLARWDTTDSARTPNGLYTILLKVVDGNGNAVGRVNFDSLVVDLRSVAQGTPYDPNDPSTDPNDPENIGPKLSNVNASPANISTQSPESVISYALANETSNVNVTIYKVAGGQIGPVAASFSMGATAPGSYSFAWNGKDNVNKRVDVGDYRARVTATAVDGTGGDTKTTSDIHMTVATEYNAGLAILGFALSSDVFDPFNMITDANGNDVQAETLTASYNLNRYAKLNVGVYDEDGALVRTLIDGNVDKIGAVSWNGASDQGVVVPSGKTYTVKIKAQCIDAGCTDVVEKNESVAVRALSIGGGGLYADVTMLVGEGDESSTDPDVIAGTLRDDDDPLNDFPLNGSSDFKWRAYGSGTIRVPFTYEISARGTELIEQNMPLETVVTPENVPLNTIEDLGDGYGCRTQDFRLMPDYVPVSNLFFDSGYTVTSYRISSVNVPDNVTMLLRTPLGERSVTAPFDIAEQPAAASDSLSIGVGLVGRPSGHNGISAADQTFLVNNCSHGQDLSLCHSYGYEHTPENTLFPTFCPNGPITICGSWYEWNYGNVVAPVTCGSVRIRANASRLLSQPWGPYVIGGNSIIDSVTDPVLVAEYNGATSSGQSYIVSSVVSSYGLTFTPSINGVAWTQTASYGTIAVGNAVRAWLGDANGPIDERQYLSPKLYADLIPDGFTTNADPYLASSACIFNGAKYINGGLNTAVDNQSRRCLSRGIEEDTQAPFKTISGPFSLYAGHPRYNQPVKDSPTLYTFSDVAHVNEWTIDLRYPDGSVNDSFMLTDMLVNSNGTSDVDGDGVSESNKNVNDSFKLKLKPDAAPKRFIEIRGAVGGEAWELRYFEPKTNSWQRIAEGQGAQNNTLAWWDVSRLNGHEYTVMLRATDANGALKSEDTMNVSIGSLVKANAPAVVSSPWRRYSIYFDEYSLCPANGPFPCDSSINELVTVIPIPTDTPGLYLPSGINPIGPIVEIKPDDIALNPTYQPQLEVYFTRDEVEALYANDPQEVKDRVYGITANDPPVMAIYNLKDDGELEQLATINTWDDRGTPGSSDDIFRISGMLNHFSRYLIMREDDGYPRLTIDAPAADSVVRGVVHITGSLGGVDPSDGIESLSVTAAPEGGSAQAISSSTTSPFDVEWTPGATQGWYQIEANARTQSGKEASASVRVYVDSRAPVTQVVVNEQLVEPGSLAVVPPASQIMLIAEDAADRGSVVTEIRYRWDEEQYQPYQGLIDLAQMPPGRHSFSCSAKDDQGNEEPEQTVFITIIDPNQPGQGAGIVTRFDIDDPHYTDGHQQWIGPATPLNIVPADGSAPVYQMRYRVNDKDYQLFNAPFTLEGFEEGVYEIEFFGIDYYGLTESVHSEPVVFDRTPPTTNIAISGSHEKSGDDEYVAADTRFSCAAEDGGLMPAGLDRIEYSVDGGTWMPYGGPFAVNDSGAGIAELEVRAIDRVGNAESPQHMHLRFDAAAPAVALLSSPSSFSPNGDGVKDETAWRVKVSGAFGERVRAELIVDGALVQSQELPAGELAISWDGKSGGQLVTDGEHAWRLVIADARGAAAAPFEGMVIVDTAAPSVAVTGVLAQNGEAKIGYRVDDNVAMQDVAAQLSVFAGQALIASVSQVASLPPVERQLAWNGANLSDARAFDGRYHYTIVVTDSAGNSSAPQSGELILDRRPPASRLSFVGPSYDDAGGVSWISGVTKIALSASDMASDVDHIDYQLDGADWQRFAAPFGIAAAGAHSVSHRAVDSVGNTEDARQKAVSVDLDPPSSQLDIQGVQRTIDGKAHWSGSATFLKMTAADQGAGVADANFQVTSPSITYHALNSFSLGDIGDGEHTGRYWSVDRVANAEDKRDVNFVLHGSPPNVTLDVGLPQYRNAATLFVDHTTPIRIKATSGADDIVYLEYRLDSGAPVTATSGGTAELSLPQFNIDEEGNHLIRYFAVDDFENRRELAYPLTVDNSPPVTTIEKSQEVAGEEQLATPSTQIRLNAHDDIVGLKSTEYRIDAGAWQPYSIPFALRNLAAGEHSVFYRSTDLLGHPEPEHKQLLDLLVLDSSMTLSQAPRILMLALADASRPEIVPADLDDVRSIQSLCAERGWPFKVVADQQEFLNAMRSDAFNVFAFASAGSGYHFDGTEFVDGLMRELAARIYNGDSLMLLQSAVSVTGVAWDKLWSNLGGVNAVPQGGATRLVRAAGDASELPTLTLSPLFSFDGNVEPLFSADDSTVVAKKTFGKGSALLVGLPMNGWDSAYATAAAGSSEVKSWGETWDELFGRLLPAEETPSPGEVISFAVKVATRDRPANASASVAVPARAALVGTAGADLSQANASWSAELIRNEEEKFVYFLRLPLDDETIELPLTLTTSWLGGLTDTTTSSFKQEISSTWSDQWANCRALIDGLRTDAAASDGAKAMLQDILSGWDGAVSAGFDEKISKALDAFDKLVVLDAEKIAPVRAELSRLVEALELGAYEASSGGIPFSQSAMDSDGDGLSDDIEIEAGTDPYDVDSDDDGVIDGRETAALADSDGDGFINALDPDSDNDGLNDGLEVGVAAAADDPDGEGPIKSTDDAAGNLVFDSDPATVTNMTKADTDGGGLTDPQEDKNLNGRVDPGETDPNNPLDDTNPTGFDGGGGGGGCTLIPEPMR